MIPVSVIVVTHNEVARIATCLDALRDFGEVIVVDSQSRDGTPDSATRCGFVCVNFVWNGAYPKKRQWCLDHLNPAYDWVFFVDADEIVTPDLARAIDAAVRAGADYAGYFVTGLYRLHGRILRHGLPNRKIALFNRQRMEFPVVNDLDIPGMGEIEGHYQPVLKTGACGTIGTVQGFLIHDALDDARAWSFRHQKYARWEAGMTVRGAWPRDPVSWRQSIKTILRSSSLRPVMMFVISYILCGGFLDGREGLELSKRKYWYYRTIQDFERTLS